mgnify:FL=1
MIRLLFEKTGTAVWMSHLDLMRVFQRSFKRAGLPLTHTKGFNPRPSVSIALPLSVGVESRCELLDFDLEGEPVPEEEILRRLNACLVPGVKGLACYQGGRKLRDLALLQCCLTLEYDRGIPQGAGDAILALFSRESLVVSKKGKNGPVDQDIIPMIHGLNLEEAGEGQLLLNACICCQNPTLNPNQLLEAIKTYLPEMAPDFCHVAREEIYDSQKNIFR